MATRRLGDLAQVVRSKNAKPFRLTFDVIFDDPAVYRRVKAAKVLTRERIAELYAIHPDQILSLHEFDAGLAIKFTFRRPVPQGAPGDSDVYGCQQHAPLLDVEVPWE